jgi:hypothetical protein
MAQGLYEVTLREEFMRINELTRSITLTSGVQARVGDKSISDSLERTVVWEYDSMASPQTMGGLRGIHRRGEAPGQGSRCGVGDG